MGNLLTNQKYHLIIFGLLFVSCILLLFGRLYKTGSAIGGDAVYYYASLRSIVVDKDLDFKNEYEYFHSQTSTFTGNRKIPKIPDQNPVTKKLPVKYPIGSAIFLLPPFFLTHSLIQSDGYNLIYQTITSLSSLIYGFSGLLLIYNLGKKIFDAKIALMGTLSIWLATPLVYYMTMEPLNSQSLSFFSVSLFIYFWFVTRKERMLYQWIILGIIGGLMGMVRYQDLLFILIPLIDTLRKYFFMKVIFLFFVILTISIQFGVNNYLYGFPFNTGYGDAGFPYLTSPKIFYSLFSFERGLLVWSPILIFAFIGLYWLIKRFKLVGSLLLLSVMIQVYVVGSWADPSQGDSFGNRILLNSSVIFALGLMQFLKEINIRQKLSLIIISLFILTNGILAGLFIFRIIGQPY